MNPAKRRSITVIKQDPAGNETWRYSGEIIKQKGHKMIIEAFFDREDMLFHGMWLCKGDRFVESYFDNRWYNIFEIYDRDTDDLKGWYCNITTPAIFEDDLISYKDLALDLLVFPDGRQLVLDEDEFRELDLADGIRSVARAALQELQNKFESELS